MFKKKYAMIFAAGLGTRLGDISKHTPKALVKINEKPLLYYLLKKLNLYGFNEIVINVFHHSEKIIDYCKTISMPNMKIHISDETGLLRDTGGGLKFASNFFKDADNILLHNADIISTINFEKLWQHHINSENIASLAVKNRKSSRQFLFNSDLYLKGWQNTDKNETIKHSNDSLNPLAFSGIHVVSKKILSFFPNEDVFSITKLYLDLSKNQKIGAYPHDNDEWVDVGKPENFEKAEEILKQICRDIS
jgi:NDP-sugar pyrophosphorylase family protein